MKIQKYRNPFSFKSEEMAKKIDEAMLNKDIDLLYTLIEQSLDLIPTQGVASQAQLYYSIGTIYGDLSNLTRNEDINLAKKQIYYFRKGIELAEASELTKDEYKPYINTFKANLYTNYGNTLDHCGRKIGAIEQYRKALSIYDSFGMALGNLGMAYTHYGMIEFDPVHRDYFHHFAYSLLERAINSDDPNTYSDAKSYFEKTVSGYDKEYIEKVLKPKLNIPQYAYEDSNELAYRKWVLENGLFLNPLNDLPVTELCFAADVIQLPDMIAKIGDKPIYHGMFNQMKQEYVYARYLYYCTVLPIDKPHYADKDTFLFNFADYPQYSIRIEQLKSSFKILYSLLDKIAYFINSYFKLGVKETDVNFRSIWWSECGKGKNKYNYLNTLSPNGNLALYSLYWISRDFCDKFEDSPNPSLKRLSDIRNALEHKYVKIVWSPLSEFVNDEIDNLVMYVSEEELYEKTMFLLKIIREAIICTSFCVNIEEEKRKDGFVQNIIIPITFDGYDDEWKI